MANKIPSSTGKWRKVHGANVLISPGGKLLIGRNAIEAHVASFKGGGSDGGGGRADTSSTSSVHYGVDITHYTNKTSPTETGQLRVALRNAHPPVPDHLPKSVKQEYANTVNMHVGMLLTVQGMQNDPNHNPATLAVAKKNLADLKQRIDHISSLDTKDKFKAYQKEQKDKKLAKEADSIERQASHVKKLQQDTSAEIEPHYKKVEAGLAEAEKARQRLIASEGYNFSKEAVRKQFFDEHFPPVAKPNASVGFSRTGYTGAAQAAHLAAVGDFHRMANKHIPPGTKFELETGTGVRANYSAEGVKQGRAILDIRSEPNVTVHELGHGLEHVNPIVGKLAAEHVRRRTEGEPIRKMSDIAGLVGYADDEVARPDRFDHPYMGKDYDSLAVALSDYHKPTEFMSMSMERLHSDPAGFAKRDPESFNFALAVLKGDFS